MAEMESEGMDKLSYHGHTRREILPYLPKRFAKVVDVGGSAGGTLSAIHQLMPSAKTVCVDTDDESLEIARGAGHETIRCDLNREIPDTFSDADVVLFLDILEHLVDPWAVLSAIVTKLRPGASVIVSLPNVRYWNVSLDLVLCGRWTLQDAGILDRTHLRFFTRTTGAALVQGGGLSLQEVIPKIASGRRFRMLNNITLGMFKDFLSPQNIYIAVKCV
jgi:2-polyprenyl-3-methyl-5-hydroxy-6-metoxy-1,4-benzoquinol methylase